MNLREWRKSAGLTGTDAAELVGTVQSHWSGIESGKTRPSPELAERIEAVTNGLISAAKLLGLTEPTSAHGFRETGQSFDSAPVKVAVPNDLADMARKYGLDVETLIAEGGVPRLREAFKAAYIERHREAIEEINTSVREHGTLSQRFGMI